MADTDSAVMDTSTAMDTEDGNSESSQVPQAVLAALSLQMYPKIAPKTPTQELDSGEISPNEEETKPGPSTEEIESAFHVMVQKPAPDSNPASDGGIKVVTKFMCRFCARQFESPEEMKEHIATHSKPGKTAIHACAVCSKVYSTPSKLQRHVRVHSGERPYACNVCGRRFTRSDHVKQHMKTHQPQRERNTCRICSMKFMRRQALHSHLQQAHLIQQVFTCNRCGEAFDCTSKLHAHKDTHSSIYPSKESSEIDGAMIIQESKKYGENENPMIIGLAKFSFGPQPNATNDAGDNSSNEGSKASDPPQIKQELEWHNGHEEKEDTDQVLNESNEIDTDGTMYISPEMMEKFIKAEPIDTEYEDSAGNQSETVNPDISVHSSNSRYVRDLWPEVSNPNDQQKKKSSIDETETAIHLNAGTKSIGNGRKVTEIVVYPKTGAKVTSYTEPVTSQTINQPLNKMKLLGPASYKAAMRKKIQMNYPYPRNQNLSIRTLVKNLGMDSSVVGVDKKVESSSEQPSSSVPPALAGKKTYKCEHCSIYFEDFSMSLLHSSLHQADDQDPFTCRKCLKKLGNRLEFTAHLIWHLEPTMDG